MSQPFDRQLKTGQFMSSISIVGSGNMASAIGTLAVKGGNAVEVISRDSAKAAALAECARQRRDGRDVVRRPGRRHRDPRRAIRQRRADRQAVRGRAGWQDHRRHHLTLRLQRHRACHPGRHLDRANGRQGRSRKCPCGQGVQHPVPRRLSPWPPLDVFMAGDDAHAKASMSVLIESLGLRPLDVGLLPMARVLENAGATADGPHRHTR